MIYEGLLLAVIYIVFFGPTIPSLRRDGLSITHSMVEVFFYPILFMFGLVYPGFLLLNLLVEILPGVVIWVPLAVLLLIAALRHE